MARKSRHPDRIWYRLRFRDVCGFICPYGVTYNAYGDKVFCKYPSEYVMQLVISKANREKIPQNYKFCHPSAWAFNASRYDENYSETFDMV